jgi:hypothetical protein
MTFWMVQRKIDEMKRDGRVERVEGKRYGRWQVNE